SDRASDGNRGQQGESPSGNGHEIDKANPIYRQVQGDHETRRRQMRFVDFRSTALVLTVLMGGWSSSVGFAQDAPSKIGDKVKFDQKLGDSIPLDATFRDEAGQTIRLEECFKGRPVILSLVYYNCPLLCTQVLNSLTRSLKPLSMSVGKDF